MQLCVWERPWKGFSKGLQGSVALPALAPVQGNRFWPPDLPISRAECCSPWCLPPFFSVEHLLLCIQEHHREHMIGETRQVAFPSRVVRALPPSVLVWGVCLTWGPSSRQAGLGLWSLHLPQRPGR